MSLVVLQHLWWIVLGTAVIAYTMLDGFDLGVGALHLFAGEDQDKRVFLNAIGPVWDMNEVWLIIIGGALFTGFPDVFAGIFSGFYILFMVFLSGLIFRAIAIEFRSKVHSPAWKALWDTLFSLGSIVITFGAGLLLANLIRGVPVTDDREVVIGFWDLFNLYSIFVGVMSIFLFATHGDLFLCMKTEGRLQKRVRSFFPWLMSLFIIFFIVVTIFTWIEAPHMLNRLSDYPIFYLVPIFMVVSILVTWWFQALAYYGWSFIFSCLTIALLFVTFAIGIYPYLIYSRPDPSLSLTIENASASATTLRVVLLIAVIGIPLVLAYAAILYTTFRRKVDINRLEY